MYLSSIVAGLSLAIPALTAPHSLNSRANANNQVVVYWGQNGGGTVENNDLSTYCTSSSGIDVIVLAFLYEYGQSGTIPSGTIGQSCYISTSGEGQQCDALASAIQTCQANGVEIILSLGGASGAYSLQSQDQAQQIGQNLWDAYGNGNAKNASIPRPFGNVFVNGWDFDIEASSGNQYYQYMIDTLRSNFALDSGNTYYITGAPQCPIPEPNMGEIIQAAQFDKLWIQFYNNPYCSAPNAYNWDDWKNYIAGTPSAGAKLYIGLPASPDASTGTSSGSEYYLDPTDLASRVNQYKGDGTFNGVMMWSAGFSDSNVNNGCTYAQEANRVLNTGSPC